MSRFRKWCRCQDRYSRVSDDLDSSPRAHELAKRRTIEVLRKNGETSMTVPDSVSFGFKILEIPTLKEVDIPLAGLGTVTRQQILSGGGFEPCWISRGDSLVQYKFRLFGSPEKSFFSRFHDPIEEESFEIQSPISGLLLDLRKESTVDFLGSLQYEWCDERLLPVILIPEDEPPPSPDNFYVYDRIASLLVHRFGSIPVRDRSKTYPERLGDRIARKGSDYSRDYQERRQVIRDRNGADKRSYNIRELNEGDTNLVDMVQRLRTKDLVLREELVHIARRFGESI